MKALHLLSQNGPIAHHGQLLLGPGRRLQRLVTRLLRLAVPAVTAATRDCDLVIAPHPFGAHALGEGRLTEQLTIPAVTYLADTSVHALWVHPAVDLNLAIHPIAAQEATALGGPATVVRALVPPPVIEASDRGAPDPLAGCEIAGPRALVTMTLGRAVTSMGALALKAGSIPSGPLASRKDARVTRAGYWFPV